LGVWKVERGTLTAYKKQDRIGRVTIKQMDKPRRGGEGKEVNLGFAMYSRAQKVPQYPEEEGRSKHAKHQPESPRGETLLTIVIGSLTTKSPDGRSLSGVEA